MKNIALLLSMIFLSCQVLALPQETGTITFLQIHQNPTGNDSDSPRFIVRISGTPTAENNCSSDSWTGQLETEGGKAMYSTLLALYIAGREVRLQGTTADTCLGGGLLIRNVYAQW